MTDFQDFGKTPRWRTAGCLVTEKIDGTNAQIYVPEDPSAPLLVGSRNRWITPDDDNAGFARFVAQHGDVWRRLGPGRHFGEWYGASIGRRYGLTDKRLALFNVDRFKDGLPEGLPDVVSLVPVLYRGALDTQAIADAAERLYAGGSVAVPGYAQPEGVVITVPGTPLRYKITDNGDQHKGCTTQHSQVVKAAAAVDKAKRDAAATPRELAAKSITVSKGPDGKFTVAAAGTTMLEVVEGKDVPATREAMIRAILGE